MYVVPVVSDGRHNTFLFLNSQLLPVTVKLSVNLIKQHSTKTHVLSLSAVDLGEWSASRLCCFTSQEKYPLGQRLGGPQNRCRRCVYRCLESNPDS